MITAIELQVISRILTSENEAEVDKLCAFDSSYYDTFKPQIEFILNYRSKYGSVPSLFNFQMEFEEEKINLVDVTEPLEFLIIELKKNKQAIIFREMFNRVKDQGSADISEVWKYIGQQCDKADMLNDVQPMDIVAQAEERSIQVIEWSQQPRIPTGFPELDKLTYGGLSTVEEMLVIVARTNTGKAQPLWSKVLTPTGWVRMGDIKIGDVVVGENNDNGKVVNIFPQGVVDYYKICFSDGTYAECCKDHLWKVLDTDRKVRSNPDYENHLILTTAQLIKDYKDKKYTIDISDPIEFNVDFDEESELDGYLLGVIIGDGCLRDGTVTISNESTEIWDTISSIVTKYNCHRSNRRKGGISIVGDKWQINYVKNKLKEYGLMGKKSIDKFIPKQYLTAPVHVRKSLLAGLVDTDGYHPKGYSNTWEFDTASEQLAQDFAELARSLGIIVKVHDRVPSHYTFNGVKHEGKGSRHIVCRSTFNPFRYSKKANRFYTREVPLNGTMPKRFAKRIDSIEYIGKTECQCIMVDNYSHTYITNDYTITHNTWILVRMMEAAQKAGFPVAYYSPEMQAAYLATRFDTWRGHYQNSDLFRGKYTAEYLNYIHKLPEGATPAFIIEDKDMVDGVSPKHLETFVKEHKIKLLIIDGISYMVDDKKSFSDHEKYAHICHDLFQLSKKYGCAIVIAAQANRETKECKDDKGMPFPNIYNIAGSDAIGQIATQVYAVRQIFDKHVLDIRLEKARMAPNENNVLSYSWDVNSGNMQYYRQLR